MNKNANTFPGSRWQMKDMCSPPLVRAPNHSQLLSNHQQDTGKHKKIPPFKDKKPQ